jgi:hypothetical protein
MNARLRQFVAVGAVALAFGMGSVTAREEAVTFVLPLPAEMTNPCNGEPIAMTGGRTLEVTRVDTSSNGGFHFLSKTTTNGRGTGLLGGTYTVLDVQNFEFDVNGGNDQSETSFVVASLVNAPVTTQDFILHSVVHITVNALGVPTSVVDNTEARCR